MQALFKIHSNDYSIGAYKPKQKILFQQKTEMDTLSHSFETTQVNKDTIFDQGSKKNQPTVLTEPIYS